MNDNFFWNLFKFIDEDDKKEIVKHIIISNSPLYNKADLEKKIISQIKENVESGKTYNSIEYTPERLNFDYYDYFISNSNSARP